MIKMSKFELKLRKGLYLTVSEEKTGFHISVINDRGDEVDGFVDPFTNLKDAETACGILAGVLR
jgi:hypothetical protein